MKRSIHHGFATLLLIIAIAVLWACPVLASTDGEAGSGPAGSSAITEAAKPDAKPVSKASGPAGETGTAHQNTAQGTRGDYLGKFDTTAYCSCSLCCSGGFSLTCSGTVPKANHTISADISRFPFGTKLMIGDIIYTVEDTGSNISDNELDIYFDSHQQALDYGRQTVDVYTVN